MIDKKTLRKQMAALRKNVTDSEAADAERKCIRALKSSPFYEQCTWFYPYISYQKELPTHALIEELLLDGKHVAVPKVLGEEMKFYEIRSLDDCEPGCMGILEPKDNRKESTEKGLLVVPGLAFDENGGRMGYGGGFYDKYLSCYPYHHTVAWFYDFQLTQSVPMEEHDHLMDAMITPGRGLFFCEHSIAQDS